MNIAIHAADGRPNKTLFPNYALMKISAYHKARNDNVEWYMAIKNDFYDIIYSSKIFDFTPEYDGEYLPPDKTVKGGPGYGNHSVKLEKEIEMCFPDYSIYPNIDFEIGQLTRGCPRDCGFCIVSKAEGRISHQVSEVKDIHKKSKKIKLLDPNLLACKDHEKILMELSNIKAKIDFTQGLDARLLNEDNIKLITRIKIDKVHFAWDSDNESDLIIKNIQQFKKVSGLQRQKISVYVLTNFDTKFDFDLYRVETLRKLDIDPYVMIYDKQHAGKLSRQLQRYVNNKRIFRTVPTFAEYNTRKG